MNAINAVGGATGAGVGVPMPKPKRLAFPVSRMVYTQIKRRTSPSGNMPLAANAVPYEQVMDPAAAPDNGLLGVPSYEEAITSTSDASLSTSPSSSAAASSAATSRSSSADDSAAAEPNNKEAVDTRFKDLEFDESRLDEGNYYRAVPRLSTSHIAVFPQYISRNAVTLVVAEASFPHRHNSFTVSLSTGEELFVVDKEKASFSKRQRIHDAKTNALILTVRRDAGKLPRSYRFDDPGERKIVDVQGNFSAPLQGSRAKAIFTNAADSTGANADAQLFMQGSWRNRHAAIKNVATGEVLANMKSELLNVRNIVGKRRTYTVDVSEGVDLALITGMIIALDARADA